MSASDKLSSRDQPAALAAGWAHVATITRQPLHGLGSPQPKNVTAEEGVIADAAYKAATGASVLGVGITAALAAAAVVRAAAIKIAPVQGFPPGIPWSLHLAAYEAYCKKWGPQPALIDLEGRGCRGGFSTGELDDFVPDWRKEVADVVRLQRVLVDLSRSVEATRPRWNDMSSAPRDGTHILAMTIEPGDDDAGTRDYEIVREVWWEPIDRGFGIATPWRSGGYGHDDRPGAESYGEGLVLCWMSIPTQGRLSRAQADAQRTASEAR